MNGKKFSIAIAGAGIGAKQVAGLIPLADRFRIAAICDRDTARAGKLADDVAAAGGARPDVVGDFGPALLARADLDIVSICLPPFLHFDAAKAALAAGKHVVCEKPLVGSLAEVDALDALARKAGRTLMPVFQYRFGKGLAQARRLVATGAAGKVYATSIETHWSRGAAYYAVPWRGRLATELGGVYLGHAIHVHDMLTELVGPVASVGALTRIRVNPIETDDCAGALFEMADGSVATSCATLGSADEITRFRMVCENVTMVCNPSPYEPDRAPWTLIPKAPNDAAWLAAALEGTEPTREGYAEQFARYYDALIAGGEPPVTMADARRSIELATAIYHSARTGERVGLPLPDDHPAYRGWR